MTDAEFVQSFERGALADFRHTDHIRLACAYLNIHDDETTLELLVEGLRRFAAAKGHPEKFHYTLTRGWLELIVAARHTHPGVRTVDALLQACPELANPRALGRYYSDEVLSSAAARVDWVAPDRHPLARTL